MEKTKSTDSVIDVLLGKEIRVRAYSAPQSGGYEEAIAVEALIRQASREYASSTEANNLLAGIGIRVDRGFMFIGVSATAKRTDLLEGTRFADPDCFNGALRAIAGADDNDGKDVRFYDFRTDKCTRIPLASVLADGEVAA